MEIDGGHFPLGEPYVRPNVERNFILQQGLEEPPAASCPLQYSALLFQPRLAGLVILVAVILKAPLIFLALAGVLWWNALFPRWGKIGVNRVSVYYGSDGAGAAAGGVSRQTQEGHPFALIHRYTIDPSFSPIHD